MKGFLSILIILFLVSGQHQICAQSKQDLQSQYKNLQSQINLTKSLIQDAKSKKAGSLQELNMINAQLNSREKLISNMNDQLHLLKSDINKNTSAIDVLESDIEQLKEDYAKMVRYAAKNSQNQNQMMFILSSKTFNQAFKRVSYLKQYGTYRKKQAEEISESIVELSEKTKVLGEQKNQQLGLLKEEESAKEALVKSQDAKDKIVKDLSAKEKDLNDDLLAKEQTAQKLNDAIEEIIRKEIAEARRKAEEEARKAAELAKKNKTADQPVKPVVKAKTYESTPASKALAASFTANKGKLPWPVDQGIVTGYFGEQPHPVLKGIKIKNNGVDIATNKDATVRALFDGTVIQVVFNPGFNKAVIVKHGEYFTVYSNLKETYVKKGDSVKTQQALGLVITNPETAKTEVHLEIWKGMTKSNPISWLAARPRS